MKKQLTRAKFRKPHQGFTLVETVIAMGIIAIMITAFMAAFGPAVKGISRSISAKEANRLAATLEYELSVLRPGESNPTAFDKSFEWIKGSVGTNKDESVLLYQYRGDPSNVRTDGSLKPQDDRSKNLPGVDYVLQSVVRRSGDAEVAVELQPGVVEGRVFYVRMGQLVYHTVKDEDNKDVIVLISGGSDPDNGSIAPGGLGQIINPHEPHATPLDSTEYLEAVVAFQAQFYVLKSSLYTYVEKFDPSDLSGDPTDDPLVTRHPKATGKPIFTRNMAVRR